MKILKKISALLLTVTLVLSLAPFAAVAAEVGSLTSIDQIATETPAGSGYWVMNKNITVSSNTPIAFSGTLDGNGHTISGLTQPLFANPSSDVTIKNLDVTAAINTSHTDGTAALIGAVTVENVNVTVEGVTVKGSVTSGSQTGAFVGLWYSTGELKVANCENYAEITSSAGTGTGSVAGTVANGTVTVTEYINYAIIEAGGQNNQVGGVIGYVHAYPNTTININFADVTNHGAVTGWTSTGGLVGGVIPQDVTASAVLKIENSLNTGAVSAQAHVGGFVGYLKGSLTVSDSRNEGTVTMLANDAAYGVGSLVGTLLEGALNVDRYKNTATGAISGPQNVGGIVGYSNASTLTINRVVNEGTVTASSHMVGGIVAHFTSAATHLTITDAVNTASVTSGGVRAGGIVGNILLSVSSGSDFYPTATLINVANTGTVTYTDQTWALGSGDNQTPNPVVAGGGIVGVCAGNEGTFTAINGAFNGGIVEANNDNTWNEFCGGIVGSLEKGKLNLTACVYVHPSEATTVDHAWGEANTTAGASCYDGKNTTFTVDDLNGDSNLAEFRAVFGDFVEASGKVTIGNGFESGDEDASPIVKVRGVQKGLDGQSVRLIAEVKGLDYTYAGFRVTLSRTNADGEVVTTRPESIRVECAYTLLYADGSKLLVHPTETGNYLIALSIKDIDPTVMQSLKVTFKPYANPNGGGATYWGEEVVYDVANGTLTH